MWTLSLLWACAGGPEPEIPAPAPVVEQPEPEPELVPPPEPKFYVQDGPIPPEMRKNMGGVSWRDGCPTPMDDLRLLTVSHYDFDGNIQLGKLVVHHEAVAPVRAAFEAAFEHEFPIRSVRPVHEFEGSDDKSMAADNTSAFNCRPVKGTNRWSEHSSGKAIDVNPRENPWVRGDKVDPPEGKDFLERDASTNGLLTAENPMTKAFLDAGWGWGGTWSSMKDYQHFSESGK